MTTSSMPAPEVAIGAVLGETYEITRLLGEGGMGAVWEAKHLRLPGKRFAVKVLHGHAAADGEAYARFRREAEIASRIGHPNIIEVLDWNTLPSGSPYLVLEFLDGEDLAARLAHGPLSVDQALAIARQIGSALKAAHAAEVVHRDLKPGNIFLVPREVGGEMADHVKVLDFGISKIRNSSTVQTQDSVLLGTPQYMAPEQALGKNHEIDGRTDVFALGAICYEMVSGKAPFLGNSLAEVVFKVVYEPVPPLGTVAPHVDPAVAAAIERAMAKAPAERFPDVGAFIAALTGRDLPTGDRRAVRGSAVAGAVPSTNRGASPYARTDGAAPEPPASHLRGEMQTRAEPPGGGRSKLAFLFAAIIVGAGGAFGAVKLLGNQGGGGKVELPVTPPPTATTVAAKTDAPKADAPKADAPKTDAPKTDAPTDPPKVATGATAGGAAPKTDAPKTDAPKTDAPKPDGKKTDELVGKKKIEARKADGPAPTLPDEVKQMLADAERALAAGKADEAIVFADRSMRVQRTPQAYGLLTRASCKKGDLGVARSHLQHVSGALRASVIKDCKRLGTDLD